MDYITAPVFNIARTSLHDGSGIRTVVYFKGCPLACKWCHNPEGINPAPEILFYESRCIKCGRCVEACPEHHSIINGFITYDRVGCISCGSCAEVCPAEALLLCGEYMTVGDVFSELCRDAEYYDKSGGGVTFSGGECLLYPDFLLELLKRCRTAGINTVVESAFFIPIANILKIFEYVDTFIIDIKHSDTVKHKELTGQGNETILKNISYVSRIHNDILIKIPLIPGATDDDETLVKTAELLNTFSAGIKAVELLKYNDLAKNKYTSLCRPFISFGKPQSDEELRDKASVLFSSLTPMIQVLPK